jgi:hypothetical protein
MTTANGDKKKITAKRWQFMSPKPEKESERLMTMRILGMKCTRRKPVLGAIAHSTIISIVTVQKLCSFTIVNHGSPPSMPYCEVFCGDPDAEYSGARNAQGYETAPLSPSDGERPATHIQRRLKELYRCGL